MKIIYTRYLTHRQSEFEHPHNYPVHKIIRNALAFEWNIRWYIN